MLVVEHDEDAIRAADHLIDMGPAAGTLGGYVIAQGTPAEVAANPASHHRRLSQRPQPHRHPEAPPRSNKDRVMPKVVGARGNNLQGRYRRLPARHLLTCVTGVSGGGKSTLVIDTLLQGSLPPPDGLGPGAGAVRPH